MGNAGWPFMRLQVVAAVVGSMASGFLRVLELEHGADFVDGVDGGVDHLARVGGRQAEPGARLDDGRGGKTHHHHADVPLQHFPTESGDLGREEEEERDDGRIGVSVEDEAAAMERRPKVTRVGRQLADALLALTAAFFAHDDAH